MKTLVTGSHGFIGKHVMEAVEGCVPFDRQYIQSQDVRSESAVRHALKDVDRVIHLAAYVDAEQSIKEPKTYWLNNVEGSRNVFKFDGPLFFASSAAIYDVLNPYALSKRVSESDLKARAETTIGRFFNVFGEGDRKSVVYKFIDAALKNEPIYINGNGKQTRSLIYVKDLVEQLDFTGGVKDIGYPSAITIKKLAERIIELANSNSPIIYREARDGDPYVSQAKAHRKPFTYGLENGLRLMIDWVTRISH